MANLKSSLLSLIMMTSITVDIQILTLKKHQQPNCGGKIDVAK